MLLAAVFDDADEAEEGVRALQDLHAHCTVTLYGHAIVARERRRGGLTVRQPFGEGLVAAAPAASAMVGALVSLLGGPATAALLTLESGLMGAVRELLEAGLEPAFLEEVTVRLRPGCIGLIAELEQDEAMPVESRIILPATCVIRGNTSEFRPDELLLRDAEALRRSHAALAAALRRGGEDAKLRALLQTRQAELEQLLARAGRLAGTLRHQAVAKVAVMRIQAALAEGAARQLVQARAGRVRGALEERALRLDRLHEEIPVLPH